MALFVNRSPIHKWRINNTLFCNVHITMTVNFPLTIVNRTYVNTSYKTRFVNILTTFGFYAFYLK